MVGMIGSLFIVSAPSGAGKTSLVAELVGSTDRIVASVSHTTRPARPGERDRVDYHFVDEPAFLKLVEAGGFLEHARVFDRHYGTSRLWVEQQLAAGTDVILEIDWQGAGQVKRLIPDAIGIFIVPPSLTELQVRLRRRAQDSQEVIERRMREAVSEMAHYAAYDYLVVNEDFHKALADLQAIVRAARLRTEHQRERLGPRLTELLSADLAT